MLFSGVVRRDLKNPKKFKAFNSVLKEDDPINKLDQFQTS